MTWTILIHALLFLVFWLTNLSFQQAVDDFLVEALGMQVQFLLIFLFFSLLVGLWSAARLALRRDARRAGPVWLFSAIGIFYLAFFYGSFVVLFTKNPVQFARLGQGLHYFRLFLDLGVLLLAALGLRRWSHHASGRKPRLPAARLFLLWLVPLIWPPGNVYAGPLPEQPWLFAHRGASQLAPENTLAAMRRAADLGVYGLETDIIISRDGVLFLMHDSTLERTTDVERVLPARSGDPADSFTHAELILLDAGSWFVDRDPYGTIAVGTISRVEAASYRAEPIPTLDEVLQVVRENDLFFIYDLRIPTAPHPYADQAFDLCLTGIEAAGIASRTWVLASPDEIDRVRAALPGVTLAAGIDYRRNPPSPEDLVSAGYRVVNSEYGLSNRRLRLFHQAGLWVNLWTVDETWQYSRLWLAGADSVTSNNVQGLIALRRPLLAIPYPFFLILWILAGAFAARILGGSLANQDPDHA
ncbi:MAG: hypothetical protein JXB85_02980 [Anaerolineales bacterium]|nr:hypothetical protein [Anaerolineales bacterium]